VVASAAGVASGESLVATGEERGELLADDVAVGTGLAVESEVGALVGDGVPLQAVTRKATTDARITKEWLNCFFTSQSPP
jgi:hypothetical protein